jgi:hypothetical protein
VRVRSRARDALIVAGGGGAGAVRNGVNRAGQRQLLLRKLLEEQLGRVAD